MPTRRTAVRRARRGRSLRRLAAALPVVGAFALAVAVLQGVPSIPTPLIDLGSRLRSSDPEFFSEAAFSVDDLPAIVVRPSVTVTAEPTAAPARPLVATRLDRPTVPGQPRSLLAGGCCAGAWWAADSSRILYIDRPEGAMVTALYGARLWPPGAAPELVDIAVGSAAGAPRLIARSEGDVSIVREMGSGEEWTLPTGGNPVLLSPGAKRAVWWEAKGGRSDVDDLRRVWGSDARGEQPRELVALWGIQVVSFLLDEDHVLVMGRPFRERPLYVLVRLNLDDGTMVELARGEWMSDPLLSPGGSHVVFLTSLDRQRPERNGVWVVATDADGYGEARKLAFEGAYRWKDDNFLAFIPMVPGAEAHELWIADVITGEQQILIDATAGVRVASNDWSIAPDGMTMAWLDQRDRNIWVMDLP